MAFRQKKEEPAPKPPPPMFGHSAAMDELLRKRLLEQMSLRPGAASAAVSGAESRGSDDSGLVSSLTARLSKVENALRAAQAQIAQKDHLIAELRAEVERLRVPEEESLAAEVQTLRAQTASLKRQVYEMETFLSDYGLVWVGEQGGSTAPQGLSSESAFIVDFAEITERIRELNMMVDKDSKFVRKGAIHHIQKLTPIRLAFYSNGFTCDGEFRPYSVPANRAYVQDILDGFFPFEYKDKYPDGVPFELDLSVRSSSAYLVPFSGQGRPLAGASDAEASSASSGGAVQLVNADRRDGTEDLLNRLPETVIHHGRVVSVRAGIADFIRGEPAAAPSVVVVPTPVIESMQHSLGRPSTPRDITTLKVRTPDNTTLVLKLRFDDTIGTVREYIQRARPDLAPYVLRTTFPSRVLDDTGATLRSLGLVPTAMLFMNAPATS